MSKITGYCLALSITAQFCLLFSDIEISILFTNIDDYCWIKTDIGKQVSYIANTFHGCFIVVLHFNGDLRGISYCFKVIQAVLGCLMGSSRLLRIVSSLLYLLFWCFSYVLGRLQGGFMPFTKVIGCFKGKFQGCLRWFQKLVGFWLWLWD